MDSTPGAQRSPDGRYEVVAEVWYERAAPEINTLVREIASGRTLLSLPGEPAAHFDQDGILHLDRPIWSRTPVQIDLARDRLRSRDDLPWLPLSADSLLREAHLLGWQQGLDYRGSAVERGFPWQDLGTSLLGLAGIVAIAVYRDLPAVMVVVLLASAALTASVFAWVFLGNLKVWLRERLERRRAPLPRARHPAAGG